jgi:hypothetical protein
MTTLSTPIAGEPQANTLAANTSTATPIPISRTDAWRSIARRVRAACDECATPGELHTMLGIMQRELMALMHPHRDPSYAEHQDATRALRQFTNDQRVVDFCHQHSLTLSGERQWYWVTKQTAGAVNGLPGTNGIPRLYNGVDVWIELVPSGKMFLGHIDWWKGAQRLGVNTRARSGSTARSAKTAKLQADLLAFLQTTKL